MTLSYDGTAYGGWQVQVNANTIQAEVERALQIVIGQPVRAVASGRTDSGVHAIGQIVSFACTTALDDDVLRRALDANLPKDIVALEVREVADGFHAIRDTIRKRYRYVIQDGPLRDVFAQRFAWYFPHRLDVRAMVGAARLLVGRHDFSSFETSGSKRVSSVRTIYDLAVHRQPGDHLERIVIEVEADGFLYNMVRNIVGTLVEVGRGKRPVGWVSEVLKARDRKLAGMTAPPQGLFLLRAWCKDEWNGERND
ncbi:MAG: tRNA pseudouridine(38-40) synthase TruA [Planctomycetes bacterium]|nr:tRNA pseudouridine(38-40) synthase TruA [Planctomycetota bacterium]